MTELLEGWADRSIYEYNDKQDENIDGRQKEMVVSWIV
jgi:hypothetical protein